MEKIIRILIAAGSLPTATPLADAEHRTHVRHVMTPVLFNANASLNDNGCLLTGKAGNIAECDWPTSPM